MGADIFITGFSSKDDKLFQKHYEAVKFCIKNGLSYPKETTEFFKGKLSGEDLEDWSDEAILEFLENGVSVSLKNCLSQDPDRWDYHILKVSKIPKGTDEIHIYLSD